MPQIISAYSLYAVLTVFLVLAVEALRRRLSRPPYPPGPKGLPLIGNVRDMPPSHEWLTYAKWSREYGSDVIHLNLLGSHLIVLNSAEAAYDLLDKRSAIYSDRPRLPMIVELMGWDVLSFYTYDDPNLRAGRRLFNQYFNPNALSSFHPQISKATHELLYRLADSPEEFMQHSHLWAGSIILNVAYGIDVQTAHNPYLVMVETAMNALKVAGNPGSFLVDVLPILKYVPEWVPGAGFQKKAREWRKDVEATANLPFEYVKDNMAKGTHAPSMTSAALEELESEGGPEAERLIRSTTAAAFSAGSDTTVSTIAGFFLAMVLHPEALKKAQQELDEVVGQHRLPEFSDLPYLPYVNAVIKEVHRWNQVLPLGVVHRLMEDDVYKGHFLPAGSLVLGNTWAILHDENVYPEPEKFYPDRFLKDGKLDPNVKSPDSAFGYGRRICPGRFFADATLFLNFSNIMSMFDITNAIDGDGKIIIPSVEYTSGTACGPKPFKCTIKPRSKQALDIITKAYSIHHPD